MRLSEDLIEFVDTIAQLQLCSHDDDAVQFLFQQYIEKIFCE
jgi:hypothetical protein